MCTAENAGFCNNVIFNNALPVSSSSANVSVKAKENLIVQPATKGMEHLNVVHADVMKDVLEDFVNVVQMK